jgi:hypothetical protein
MKEEALPFAKALQVSLQLAHLSVAELARRSKVSYFKVYRLKRGTRQPTAADIGRLGAVLGWPPVGRARRRHRASS